MFPGNTGVCTVISRWHDRPDHDASTTRRAVPVYAVLILALALLMAGFQPWNHGFSSNTAVMDGAGSALALSADCGRSDRNAGMPAASQCLLHAACAVSLGCDASMQPVSFTADWPVFLAGTDPDLRRPPDPEPPRFWG